MIPVVEGTEVRKLAALEDRHWWYRERRALLSRQLRRLGPPGVAPGVAPGAPCTPRVALDIGAAGGGNTRVLRRHGWRAVALEYGADGAEVARERGLDVLRADARAVPVRSASVGLVVAFDILEHIEEDHVAAGEMLRILRPGGTALVAVPCDMRLWSAHDVAVGHVRRYTRQSLRDVMEKAGFVVDSVWSWNVLLRPLAAWRRRHSTGSDLTHVPAVLNRGLSMVVAAERYLPVGNLPGVSLVLRASRPA